jgi:hypothetical protein
LTAQQISTDIKNIKNIQAVSFKTPLFKMKLFGTVLLLWDGDSEGDHILALDIGLS